MYKEIMKTFPIGTRIIMGNNRGIVYGIDASGNLHCVFENHVCKEITVGKDVVYKETITAIGRLT